MVGHLHWRFELAGQLGLCPPGLAVQWGANYMVKWQAFVVYPASASIHLSNIVVYMGGLHSTIGTGCGVGWGQ